MITPHLRVARPTNDIAAVLPFYCEGLGLQVPVLQRDAWIDASA